MSRKPYASDLTDAPWTLIEPRIPPATPGGRPRSVDIREVINAICYLLRTGCSWRMLPHDLPPWGTVHYYFWLWRRSGFWEELHINRTSFRQTPILNSLVLMMHFDVVE